MNTDGQSIVAKDAKDGIESKSSCQRQKRGVKGTSCPQYYKVAFNGSVFPGYKIELFCDYSKKTTCKSQCVQQKRVIDIPRLKFLGIRIVKDNPVYYFQEFVEEDNAFCLCN